LGNFDATIMAKMEQRLRLLVIVSIAAYRDQFDKKHITMACNVPDIPRIDYFQASMETPFVMKMADCGQYNCIDEECRDYRGAPGVPRDVIP